MIDPPSNNPPTVASDGNAMPEPYPRLWTTSEVSDFLQVSLKTVFNLRKTGLPYVQLGGAVRFDPQAVKGYLASNGRLSMHRRRQSIRKGGKI